MSNTTGKIFTLTTAGESHGLAMIAIVDGCPSGLTLSEDDFTNDLNRRKTGRSAYTSQRQESDCIQILSGVFEGKTTGAPIALLIPNDNARPRDYEKIKDVFRPGHADYTYQKKYGIRDYRGGGRSSARETVLWVAAGVIAKKYLHEHYGIEIHACVTQIGPIKAETLNLEAAFNNAFFFADENQVSALENYFVDLRREGNSIGGCVEVFAKNVPIGLGEPVFHKLDAEIAAAFMGIHAVKGVEIGDGFSVVMQKGSEHRDEITPEGFLSNHAGGILGGISTGQMIMARLAFKPASSIRIPGKTIDVHGDAAEIITTGRHDPCVAIRAVPVVEARLAMVLMDALMMCNASLM